MTLTLEVSDELERKLIARAQAVGQDAGQYIQHVLERELRAASLNEVLAPFRDQVQKSGVTDDELDALVEQARSARVQEHRNKSA